MNKILWTVMRSIKNSGLQQTKLHVVVYVVGEQLFVAYRLQLRAVTVRILNVSSARSEHKRGCVRSENLSFCVWKSGIQRFIRRSMISVKQKTRVRKTEKKQLSFQGKNLGIRETSPSRLNCNSNGCVSRCFENRDRCD